MKNIQFVLWLISVTVLIFWLSVCSFGGEPLTDADYARLPPYCKARLNPGKGEAEYWKKRIGPAFIHIHHYCHSLNALNKLISVNDKETKDRILRRSINGLRYLQDRTTKDFYLRPEIAYKIGNVYYRLGDFLEAAKEFSSGIKLYPKYVLNYIGLSRLSKKQGDIATAKKVLELGLKHNPSSKLLKKRLKRLEK